MINVLYKGLNKLFFSITLMDLENIIVAFFITFIDISMILVFIEVIELNFLGLSTMTKRNIDFRTNLEMENENNINDIIIEDKIIFDGYELELKNEKELDEKTVSND